MPSLPTADLLSETNNAGQYRVRAMGSIRRNAKYPETNPEVWKMVMDRFLLAFRNAEPFGFPAVAELLYNLTYGYTVTKLFLKCLLLQVFQDKISG